MKHYTVWLLGFCLIGTSVMAYAETRYVTDELQLALYELINSKGKMLMRLNSGTELELLEENGFYAKVRAKDGTEGWTKAGFLIKKKPARAQLEELKVENKSLSEALEEKNLQLSKIEADLKRVKEAEHHNNSAVTVEKQDDLTVNKDEIIAALDRVQQENEELRQHRTTNLLQAVPLNWGLIAAGITFLLGLVSGFALFDYLSRKRHGGYRIY